MKQIKFYTLEERQPPLDKPIIVARIQSHDEITAASVLCERAFFHDGGFWHGGLKMLDDTLWAEVESFLPCLDCWGTGYKHCGDSTCGAIACTRCYCGSIV